MKNKLIYLIVIFLSIGVFANSASAYGTFELIDFPDALNAVAGKAFTKHVDFFYSGGYTSSPRISVVGKNFPTGMSMSGASAGGGNLYNATYSGTPTEPGTYNLILTLTDYEGAQLNKNFVFKVAGLTMDEQLLPNAVVNTPYIYDVTYKYDGDKDPVFVLSDLPDYVRVDALSTYGNFGTFKLRFTSWKEGIFTFKVKAYVNGVVGEKVFTVAVDGKKQLTIPEIISTSVDIATATPTNSVITAPISSTPVQSSTINKAQTTTSLSKSTIKTAPTIQETEVSTIPKKEPTVSHDVSSSTNDSSREVLPIIDKQVVPHRTWYYWLNPFNWFK